MDPRRDQRPATGSMLGTPSAKADAIAEPSIAASIDDPADLRRLPRSLLPQIANELRRDLVEAISKTGGHLGSGLGAVELTVALHHAFDTPRDVLIWDVSHQCYPHKLLTGRRRQMARLRQAGGPAGFTTRKESVYDPFGAAHSSTSISAALGFATARDLAGDDYSVVAVIGDGAMSGGMAFEGLNNAGAHGRRLIVVLNDNNMSIAPPSGALSTYLTALRSRLPDKEQRDAALASGTLPDFSGQPTLFGDLGLRYAGPFDGHDVAELDRVFELARSYRDGPLLIHIITEKGHGYAPAATSADKGHGVEKFDVATGKQSKSAPKAPTYTSVFARALIDEATRDDRVVAITAAMPSGTGLDKFGAAFPDRCFDAGIAEQHAVTFAAGLACKGFKPFAAIYSTFLQRAYDQIVHDVAIQQLPVRFAIDRAGLVGSDGFTHHGTYDIAYLGCLPGFVLMAAADEAELMHMVATATAIDDRPSAFRYPRGEGLGVALPDRGIPLEIGRGRMIQEGGNIAILSYGARLGAAIEAARLLAQHDIFVTIADGRFAKPFDDRLLATLVHEHKLVLTLEEGSSGGFAALAMQSLARQGLDHRLDRLRPLYLPDAFIEHDTQSGQLSVAGLDAQGIVNHVFELTRRSRLAPMRITANAAE